LTVDEVIAKSSTSRVFLRHSVYNVCYTRSIKLLTYYLSQ